MASLQEARRERDEAVARMAEEDEAASNRENRGGIVQSIEESAKSLLGAVTGATKNKTQEVSDKARETKDAGTEKVGEMKDRMEETTERASKSKDRNTAKMMDYEDTSEERGSSSEKLGEYKESAAEAARKAREFLIEGKEEARVELAGKTKVDLCYICSNILLSIMLEFTIAYFFCMSRIEKEKPSLVGSSWKLWSTGLQRRQRRIEGTLMNLMREISMQICLILCD